MRCDAYAINPYRLDSPCVALQQVCERCRNVLRVECSLVAVSQHSAHTVVGSHDDKTFAMPVVEQMQGRFCRLYPSAFCRRY